MKKTHSTEYEQLVTELTIEGRFDLINLLNIVIKQEMVVITEKCLKDIDTITKTHEEYKEFMDTNTKNIKSQMHDISERLNAIENEE